MKLVVGLGNPGRKYQGTRHNLGYEVLAELARRHAVGPVTQRFHGELANLQLAGERVFLLSPLTYMNRSGQSVRAAFDFYKLELGDVLVICDCLSLPPGQLRFRPKGSAGGQKGLSDVIQRLGNDQFARLRVGIGPTPPQWDAADYVLGQFSKEERPVIDHAVRTAASGVEDWVAHGVTYCMNQYNGAAT